MTDTTPAGRRFYSKARTTGTHVGTYDGKAAGLDTEGGRWTTVCEEHSNTAAHKTLQDARDWAAHPEQWCDECRAPEPAPEVL